MAHRVSHICRMLALCLLEHALALAVRAPLCSTHGRASAAARALVQGTRSLTRSSHKACMTEAAATEANVLILDHLNINHEKGRHDLVKAFYFETLGLTPDPRKAQNLEAGRKTLWANAGIHQFHLPEGPTAQVFDGVITLAYESLAAVRGRLSAPPAALKASAFAVLEEAEGRVAVRDPWGTRFVLVEDAAAADARGAQPGRPSECLGMVDLTVSCRPGSLGALRRFYEEVLGCRVARCDEQQELVLRCGPAQTLTFRPREEAAEGGSVRHEELEETEGGGRANHGAHVSMYVADLPAAYNRAAAVGALFVNERFKRKAYTLAEATEQCMFRVLDLVDPEAPEGAPPALRLEHEVRACVTPDGKKYKSCPFYEIPDA